MKKLNLRIINMRKDSITITYARHSLKNIYYHFIVHKFATCLFKPHQHPLILSSVFILNRRGGEEVISHNTFYSRPAFLKLIS